MGAGGGDLDSATNIQGNDGTRIGSAGDALKVSSPQFLDTGNSKVITSADASPGSPWTGAWQQTRSIGITRQLVVLASNVTSGLGGTFTFQYSEDGSTPTINEARVISTFSSVRDFPLENFGEWFRVIFEPSRVMTGGEIVFLTTQHSRQFDGQFSRLANQEIEEQNAAMPQTFSYAKNFNLDGLSSTYRLGGNDPLNSTKVGLGAAGTFTGAYRDTGSYQSALIFIFSDVPLTVTLRWSPDGVTPRTGPLATSVLTSTLLTGYYLYLSTLTTFVDQYFRLEIVNGATPTTLFEADVWLYNSGFPGSFAGLTSTLSSLSTALLTRSVIAGNDPNNAFANIRTQGPHDGNSTATPLVAGGVFRGVWFPWQSSYVKMISDLRSDVAGTFYVDFSEATTPVDGDESSVAQSKTFAYDPSNLLFKIQTPVQSKWVRHRYVNGVAAQSVFELDTAFLTADPGLVSQTLALLPTLINQAGIVRAVPAILNPAGTAYVEVPVHTSGVPKAYITHVEDDLLIEPLSSAAPTQLVAGITATRLDPSPLANRRAIRIKNEGPGRAAFGHTTGLTFDAASCRIDVGEAVSMGIDAALPVYGIAENTGGTQTTLDRTAATAAGTATNPNNAKTSDNSYATMTSGQTLDMSAFTAGTANALVAVKLGIEANKTAAQFETVAHVATVTGSGGNVGTVVSGTVTSAAGQLYLAAVSCKNGNATVTSVAGLGLTWVQVAAVANGTNRAIAVWQGTGTPTGNGTVTATFSASATASNIAVSRYTNVDVTTPVQAFAVGTGSSNAPSAGAVAGTNKGLAFFACNYDNDTMTPGSGYTEQSDVASSAHDGLGTETKALTATGNETPTATISSSRQWCAVALTLTPAAAVDPVITLSYTLSGVAGATSGTATLTSATDATTLVDVTADRSWVVADIANVHVIATGTTISAALANVDLVFLELVDTTGNTARFSVWQGAKATA